MLKSLKMTFVIFHGSFGSPKENWFPALADFLKNLNQDILVPQFPVDDYENLKKDSESVQNLHSWINTFEKLLSDIKNKQLCFIAHSIAPVFLLHAVSKYNLHLDSAIFVAPFFNLPKDLWQFEKVNHTFYKTDFNFGKLRKLISTSYSVYSDNDPYVPIKNSQLFADKMRSSPIIVRGGEHCGSIFKKFPLVEELCRTRIQI